MKLPRQFDVVGLIPKTSYAKKNILLYDDIVDVIQVTNSSFCVLTNNGLLKWIDYPVDDDFLWRKHD
jgi:hypothetical protein